jgi:hypothetical protein
VRAEEWRFWNWVNESNHHPASFQAFNFGQDTLPFQHSFLIFKMEKANMADLRHEIIY